MIEGLLLALLLFPLTVVLSVAVPFLLRSVYALVSVCSQPIGSALREQYADAIAGRPRIVQLYESLYLFLRLPLDLGSEFMSHRQSPDRGHTEPRRYPSVSSAISAGARRFFTSDFRLDLLDATTMWAWLPAGFIPGISWLMISIVAVTLLRRLPFVLLTVHRVTREEELRTEFCLRTIAIAPLLVVGFSSATAFVLGESWWQWIAGGVWWLVVVYPNRVNDWGWRTLRHPFVTRGVARLLRVAGAQHGAAS